MKMISLGPLPMRQPEALKKWNWHLGTVTGATGSLNEMLLQRNSPSATSNSIGDCTAAHKQMP